MIFSAAPFLYLLPLAALPVVFHFIFKQKRRTVVFSSLMFFHRTDPKLNSRRKIRQWLLLLMRILLIAFLLLALSRPMIEAAATRLGKVRVVAVVDNSGSMSGVSTAGDKKLQSAVEGARRLILGLERSSEAGLVLLVDDPAVERDDSLTTDKKTLGDSLDRIQPTEATGNVSRAMQQALGMLDTGPLSTGAIHIFTDLQESEWAAQVEATGNPAPGVTVYVHKIESAPQEQANVTIRAIQFPQEKILPRQPYTVGVVVQNNSAFAGTIRLNSIDSQDQPHTERLTLQEGVSKTVELAFEPEEPGVYWMQVWIEGDDFAQDNKAGVGIFCEEAASVLFVGAPRDFGVLPVALSPTGEGQFTGLAARFCLLEHLSETAAAKRPIMIVTTWSQLSQMSASESSAWLRDFVETGGNLLVVPSPRHQNISAKPPGWLGATIGQRTVSAGGLKLEVLEKRADFWRHALSESYPMDLQGARAYAFYPLAFNGEFERLVGVDFQNVLLARKKLGKGNIYVSGTAFDSHWNTLPHTGLLVVMAQRMALEGAVSSGPETISLVAGEPITGISPGADVARVISLVGDALDWQGQAKQMPLLPRAGVYVAKAGDNNRYCICVRGSEKEGLQRFVDGPQVAALGATDHTVLPYDDTEDFSPGHMGRARVIDLYVPLLILATLALLAEGLLAQRGRTKQRSAKRETVKAKTAILEASEEKKSATQGATEPFEEAVASGRIA